MTRFPLPAESKAANTMARLFKLSSPLVSGITDTAPPNILQNKEPLLLRGHKNLMPYRLNRQKLRCIMRII